MDLIFLGTGGAWRLPELNCDCLICRSMRRRREKRDRTALLLTGGMNVLIDCGPDIASQLSRHRITGLDAVLITHEHSDHFIGMDELFSYKRTCPRGSFDPIPVYLTAESWAVIGQRFSYLVDMGVISVHKVVPGGSFSFLGLNILPFKTRHSATAPGSVGYLLEGTGERGKAIRIVYTSDFMDIPDHLPQLMQPDYLIIQSFWLNEPIRNRPCHMSFQRALNFIALWRPLKETFLVHIGDGDMIPHDPANGMLKKYEALDPLTPPGSDHPYPIPLEQEAWQMTVDRILKDRQLPYKITAAYDDLTIRL